MAERKIALVTGASKGIGAAIASALAADGFDIWLNYRSDEEGASRVAESVKAAGGNCRLLKFDVADEDAVKAVLDPMLKSETPFALVNNAGFARDGLLLTMKPGEWKSVMAVTLDGFYIVTKRVLKTMLKKRQGRIINISSTSGQMGMPGQVNYSSAKAGLIGATKSLASEVARRNILVNAVAPGFVETEMTREISKDKTLPMIPLGRFGLPEEIAGTVSFLCSDRASYITGQVIGVNGGAYM